MRKDLFYPLKLISWELYMTVLCFPFRATVCFSLRNKNKNKMVQFLQRKRNIKYWGTTSWLYQEATAPVQARGLGVVRFQKYFGGRTDGFAEGSGVGVSDQEERVSFWCLNKLVTTSWWL